MNIPSIGIIGGSGLYQIEGFAEAVHREVAARTRRGARAWLKHEMTHWATPGHTDDKTISMIFRG